MTINYKGAEIYYSVTGRGNPLILLHGFLEDSRIWDNIIADLSKKRQVICIDLPGHGRSEGFSEVHSMEEMADVIKKVTETIGAEQCSIAGHSMGGYVSLEFYNKFPMIVKSLMLINSTPVEDSPEKRQTRDRSVQLVEKNKKAYIKMAIPNLFSAESKVKFCPEIEELERRAMKMEAKNIQAALKGMKIRKDHLKLLEEADIQKVVVGGKQDPILDFQELKEISEKCNCEFYATENGHNSYIEDSYGLAKIMHFID